MSDDTGSSELSLLLKEEVYAIVGAGIAVHSYFGNGFLEAVYQEALELELGERGIPFKSQVKMNLCYRGTELSKKYTADIVCYDKIVVELKAISALTKTEESQLLHYLKATGMQVGILMNFGSYRKMEWKRMVSSDDTYVQNAKLLRDT